MKKRFTIIIAIIIIIISIISLFFAFKNITKNNVKYKFKTKDSIESLNESDLISLSNDSTITKYNGTIPIIEKEHEKEKIICPGSAESYEKAKELAEASQEVVYNTTATIYDEKESKNYYTFFSKNIINDSDKISNYSKIIVLKNEYATIKNNNTQTLNFKLNKKNIKKYMDLLLFLKTNSNPYYSGSRYLNSFIEENDNNFIYTNYYINIEKVVDNSKTKSLTYITLYKSESTINKETKTITNSTISELLKIH